MTICVLASPLICSHCCYLPQHWPVHGWRVICVCVWPKYIFSVLISVFFVLMNKKIHPHTHMHTPYSSLLKCMRDAQKQSASIIHTIVQMENLSWAFRLATMVLVFCNSEHHLLNVGELRMCFLASCFHPVAFDLTATEALTGLTDFELDRLYKFPPPKKNLGYASIR